MSDDFEHFDKHEQKIIKRLYNIRIKQSTLGLAKGLKMHWTTVESALNDLENRGWVIRKELGNKTMWQFNFKGYYDMKKKEKNKRGD